MPSPRPSTRRRARWLVRAGVVLGAGLLGHCHRTVVTRPGLVVTVTDAQGAPVPGAHVMLVHWSYPYARIDHHFGGVADDTGRFRADEVREDERIAPLCMHGVPEHHYTVCAGVPGRGLAVVPWKPGEPATIALRLSGEYADECASPEAATRADRTR
ncbi:MAG: carboxypeptidase regulatory-like domain-containing protein [Kofleriaceae bacterium]|jgi:hypothetical protein|nr:carboxypeptidase regulatory-like domain-containing protein [Kofleriaceae bacterium]MBP6839639.1 carboxypeptidase regulatory-like domain-containing protein [Kofleriaceae bacterium]